MPARRMAVTGAFGFTGRAITERLLGGGHEVVTLTRRAGAGDPLAQRIDVRPFDPTRPADLAASLAGADTVSSLTSSEPPSGAGPSSCRCPGRSSSPPRGCWASSSATSS